MDLKNLALFKMAATKMDWVAQRHKVLAENVANADTPGYRARDLRKLDFKRMAEDAMDTTPQQAVTRPGHVRASLSEQGPFRTETDRHPYETSISENGVVLEEQVEKIADGRGQYGLALKLMRKNLDMLNTALGRRGG